MHSEYISMEHNHKVFVTQKLHLANVVVHGIAVGG